MRAQAVGVVLVVAFSVVFGTCASAPLSAQVPLGDAPVRVEEGRVIATAIGLVPEGENSLAARRLSARSLARLRATAMLHAYLDAALGRASISPRLVRDLHAAVDAHLDLRRIRSRADGSAVIELAVPTSVLAEVACAPGLPWCP